MSEGRYNIPKQYKVDKGMPLEALFQKIDNLKCRRIFEAEIECVEWSYHLVDKEGVKDMKELIREPGLSVFEVKLKRKLSPELLTEVFTGLFFRPIVMVYVCGGELAMGLSQLYQLRGRVGRSNRTSYAFLMYKKDKMLKEIAEKRLQAIREFTDLGSGFKIAMKDLEIRGAGNLLGERQHGHMEAVGYDLYCKMLNEAVKTLKGMKKAEEDFDTYVDMDVDAFIPPEYIVNEVQKLEIYKRIASLENEAECDDMRKELKDRFGTVPKSVENLIQISLIRVMAHRRYVTEIKGKMGQITFFMEPYAPVHVERLPKLMAKYQGVLEFSAKGTPNFVLKYKKYGLIEKEAELMMSYTNKVLTDFTMLYDAQLVCAAT